MEQDAENILTRRISNPKPFFTIRKFKVKSIIVSFRLKTNSFFVESEI